MGYVNLSNKTFVSQSISLLERIKELKPKLSKIFLQSMEERFGGDFENIGGYTDCTNTIISNYALHPNFRFLSDVSSKDDSVEKIEGLSVYSRAWRGKIEEHEITIDYNIGTGDAPCLVELFLETDGDFKIYKVDMGFKDDEDNQYLSYWLLMAEAHSRD